MTWLEGWDETMLKETGFTPIVLRERDKAEETPIPAVCSTAFLEAHGKTLGDEINVTVQADYNGYYRWDVPAILRIVGSYVQQNNRAQVYVPLSCYLPPERLTGGEDPFRISERALFTFRTCRFHLTSARELDTIRVRLRSNGFSAVGAIAANRTTLLLRDAAFLKLKDSMERNITMGQVMSAVISLLIVTLGFIISWLMTYSRRKEFALMRGFGAGKRRVFASFFLEQAILSITGCLAGCLALFRLYAGGASQPLAAAAYLVCYLLGTAISILIIGKTNLMELLSVRE